MTRLIIKRFLYGLVTLIATSLLIFLGTEAMPGDFASELLGREYSQQTGDVIREKLGLYHSLPERYAQWLVRMVRFDFGSAWAGYAIEPVVSRRLLRTLWLAFFVALVSFPIAIALGVFTALRRYSRTDRVLLGSSAVMISTPEFLVGYALMGMLAVGLGWLPSLALVEDSAPLLEKLHAAILPILTLAIITIPPVMRIVRAALINTLSAPYVQMAELKGLTPARIMLHHVIPNNIGTIANAVSLGFAVLITGVVIIEIIFVYPGLGTLFVDAVSARDVPVIQACGVIFASIYVVLILLADIVSIAANPRLVSRQAMAYITPGHLRAGYKIAIAAGVAGLGIYIATELSSRSPVVRFAAPPPTAANTNTTNKAHGRVHARHTGLMDDTASLQAPLQNSQFLPVGEHSAALHAFNAGVKIDTSEIIGQRAGGVPRTGFGSFPAVTIHFVSHQGQLIPVEPGLMETDNPNWSLLVGAGRIWSEAGDAGYSRASFPFALIGKRDGSARNGLAMFTFDEQTISNLRYQIVQESSPWYKFDAWGQLNAQRVATHPPDTQHLIDDYLAFAARREPVKPWSVLYDSINPALLDYFDSQGGKEHITSSGMIIDGVIYSRGCHTRYGDYPYCDAMRHSVYSVAKSMGAALALLRLAEKYGVDVLDEKILDYIDIPADHDGWQGVRFRHAIDMATGIGNVVPERVNTYVDADNSPLGQAVFAARTVDDKLRAIGAFGRYPWQPGEVLRYRTVDTFVLSAAMDRFLKTREGDDAQLWEMMLSEVYRPIGIRHLPVAYAHDPDPRRRVPELGWQMFATVDDIAKVVKLIRNQGRYKSEQVLHKALTRKLMEVDRETGLPSGWYYRRGGQAHYATSLWLIPYQVDDDCWIVAPTMHGVGGNYVIMVPNGVTAYRLADGYADNPATYDTYTMRRIADFVRPSCDYVQ